MSEKILSTAATVGPFLLATDEQRKAIKMLGDAIVDSVRIAGRVGAPGGVLYSALMAHGCSLEIFEAIMGSLVRLGRLERRGNLYFAK